MKRQSNQKLDKSQIKQDVFHDEGYLDDKQTNGKMFTITYH